MDSDVRNQGEQITKALVRIADVLHEISGELSAIRKAINPDAEDPKAKQKPESPSRLGRRP